MVLPISGSVSGVWDSGALIIPDSCLVTCLSSVPIGETVQCPTRADIQAAIRNRRRRATGVAEIIDSEDLPFAARLNHRDLSFLAQSVDLVITGDRRRKIIAERAGQPSLLENPSARGID